ncbi:MAG: hypothetical protein OEY34_00390 [Cyclobacteriaceae bacterium]|nr:hypothetical protein [Cyclobacteriaceae bacterium]
MKKIFILPFLMFSFLSFTFIDGGGGSIKCYIRDYNPANDLFYISIDKTITIQNDKNKEKSYDITSNIAIYDTNKESTTYLFDDSFDETISNFFYESYYDTEQKKLICNRDYRFKLLGNENLLIDTISDQLIIETYSFKSGMYSLWTAHKEGGHLKREIQFTTETEYYIDVKNKVIRILKQTEPKIDFVNIPY